MAYYIGIDIGGTKCAVTLASGSGENILSKTRFLTEASRGPGAVVSDIISAVNAAVRSAGLAPSDIRAAGISCGGPLDSRKGLILGPPNLPGWDRVPVVSLIEEGCGIKTFLQNDANACALAEWKFGAGRGCRNMIFLTFGTGMGAGLILDGRLYAGANDMAGEVGHIRLAPDGPEGYGKRGSFEGFCSGGGIARYALELARRSGEISVSDVPRDAKSLAEAAENGDAFAIKVWSDCGERLGQALAVLVDILNPELIVIGSIFARSGHLLKGPMEKTLKSEALPISLGACRIVPAALGESIGDYAAIGVAVAGAEGK